jgi:hypothetical protein
MSDLIKKEEAKEAVCKGCLKDWGICQHHWDCPMLTNLEMLPSAGRPQGEWETIGKNHIYKRCPFCKRVRAFTDTRFCDWCGARMFAKDINVPNKKGAEDDQP